VWTTDEGLGGVKAHIANDRPTILIARLRIALYRNLEQRVGEAEEEIVLHPHGSCERDVEALLGHFVDASWAYKFGPPAQHVIVASLEADDRDERRLLSQSFHFPAGRPTARDSAEQIGLDVSASAIDGGNVRLRLNSRRLAWGLRMHVPGFIPDDDAFSIEPGHARIVTMRPRASESAFISGSLTALNLAGRVTFKSTTETGTEGRSR
jgi:beta-mannosidase